jgi:hypothetical protein
MKGTGSVSCPVGFFPERYWCTNVEACVSSTTMLGTVFECLLRAICLRNVAVELLPLRIREPQGWSGHRG